MKLVELKCKNCGATLHVDEDQSNITCQYCQAQFRLDNDIHHVKYDDMEQAGYDFEKGKIRARQEYMNDKIDNNYNLKANKSKLWLWIIGWIFCFPIPLTVLIWRSKWDNKKKIIVTIILWITILIIGAVTPDDPSKTQPSNNRQTNQQEGKVKRLII